MQPNTEKKPGYEERDIHVGAILRPALGLFLVTVFTFVAMRWTFQFFEWRAARDDRPAPARALVRELPPQPRLQQSPPADLAEMRAAEEKVLRTYGWIDRENGIVRIPIERAMNLVAERGLPARKEAAR